VSYYQFDLTPRQQQILEMMLDGKTNAQIAKELGYGKQSIKNQIAGTEDRTWGAGSPRSIFKTMGVRDRTQAVIAYLGWRSLKHRGLA